MDMDTAYDSLIDGEIQQIHSIAVRAGKLNKKLNLMHVEMDLVATNTTCPLDFDKMGKAPDFDLMHDIYGIGQHLNRKTFELKSCFLPRCTLR